VALEAGRSTYQHEAGRLAAAVGERMRHPARREGELASPRGDQLIRDLEGQFAFDDVEGLVEVVSVQGRALGIGRHDVVHDRHLCVGLLAAQQDIDGALRHRQRRGSCILGADPGSDDHRLGIRLRRGGRRLDAGLLGGNPVEVALEPARGADEEVARGSVRQVGERVVVAAAGECERALRRRGLLVTHLEGQLAIEHAERLVEVVPVQRRPLPPRRDGVLDNGDRAAGLLTAQQDGGPERCGGHAHLLMTCGWRSAAAALAAGARRSARARRAERRPGRRSGRRR
jgi:hypothetical protein